MIELENGKIKLKPLRINHDIIRNDIPYKGELYITVKDNEIPVSSGDFWRMNNAGQFDSVFIDDKDPLKIVGKMNNKVYVSSEILDNLSDDLKDEYYNRRGVTEESTDILFGMSVPLMSSDDLNKKGC